MTMLRTIVFINWPIGLSFDKNSRTPPEDLGCHAVCKVNGGSIITYMKLTKTEPTAETILLHILFIFR